MCYLMLCEDSISGGIPWLHSHEEAQCVLKGESNTCKERMEWTQAQLAQLFP